MAFTGEEGGSMRLQAGRAFFLYKKEILKE